MYVRGIGVYGEFVVFGDFSDLIFLVLFISKGKIILVFVCFLMVIYLKGLLEMLCDLWGFVIKFYIE